MKSIYLVLREGLIICIGLGFWSSQPAWSKTSQTNPIDTENSITHLEGTPPSNPSVLSESPPNHSGTQGGALNSSSTLGINVRVDAQYSGGGSITQGFSIPSVRVSGFGEVGNHLNYRLSLGQTKEFSTANLPQVIPVEAFIVFNVNSEKSDPESNLRFKAGLFSPSFNPVWTPDLSDLNIPDFNETHKALFLSREAGAELSYLPFKKVVELSVGAFNGTGVLAQNTNSAKAFTVSLKTKFSLGSWQLLLGTGNYFLKQSEPGSVNYKSTSVSDVFAGIQSDSAKTQLLLDAFTGHFEDKVRTVNAVGGSLVFNAELNSWLGFFGRYEYSTRSPLSIGCIRQFQVGPEIYFDDNVKTFLTYGQLETSGSIDKTVMIRMRLGI